MNGTGLILLGLVIGLLVGMSSTLIGAFTTYITAKLGKKSSSNAIAATGLLVILYMVMLLIILAAATSAVIDALAHEYQQALLVAVPIVGIFIGISFIRRYFWHEPLIQITHVKQLAKKHVTKSTSFLQPLYVASTLLYIIAPVLLVTLFSFGLITLLVDQLPLFWYVPFAFGVITPLYGILALLSTKTKASKILIWKDKTKATMYLYSGLSLVLLAWIVFYITIQQGGL